jgi:hypothetical protein
MVASLVRLYSRSEGVESLSFGGAAMNTEK